MYDPIPVDDKKLHWIEGTTERFCGYIYLSEHPEQMMDWYDAHSAA